MQARRWPLHSLLALVLAVLAIAAAASGCGSSAGSSGTAGTLTDSPKNGGSIAFAFQEEPTSLDPAVCWDVIGTQIEHQIYRGVIAYEPKSGAAGLNLAPDLATEVPTAANGGITNGGKTITFHLRKGVMFQAPVSREVTAEDFKYSFERMIGLPTAPATYFYMGVVGAQAYYEKKAPTVTGFKVIDPYTFEINLTRPDLSFVGAYGGMDFCDVVPKEWVEKWGKQFNRHPLGTGPFMFDHWTQGQEIVLKKNPDYWQKGKPYLDELVYRFSVFPQTAFLRLQRGDVDVLGNFVPTPDVALAKASPTLKQNLKSQLQMGTMYLFMNTQMKPFDNVKVRQAISWAVNREKLVKLLAGTAVPLWQIYPQLVPGYEAGKQFFGYDPAKAKALLAEAGYPDGFKTMLYTDNVAPHPQLMQSIQADLAATGITAGIKTMSTDTYRSFIDTPGSATMGLQSWGMDFPDPIDWISPFFSKAAAVKGGSNSSFWWTPQMEKMIAEAQAMTDPSARFAKFQDMQNYIMTQPPYVTLYQPVMTDLCSENVGGFYLQTAFIWDPINYWRK